MVDYLKFISGAGINLVWLKNSISGKFNPENTANVDGLHINLVLGKNTIEPFYQIGRFGE